MKSTSRRDFLKTMVAAGTLTALPGCDLFDKKHAPNIVFFLIDDLGWKDTGGTGSPFYETPNIDRLAASGMQFTYAYAASPVCSPTRASIMTGKHPARLNITDWIPGDDPKDRKLLGPQDQHVLPLEEMTIAEVLKEKGYATGFFGKWHLGKRGHYPEDQGFDVNVGGHWAGQPASYFYPYKNPRKRWDVPGLEGGEDGEYLTDRLTDESIGFIETNRDKPFFLMLSHYAVHTPIQSRPDLEEKYSQKLADSPPPAGPAYIQEGSAKSKQHQDDAAYAGMVESVDESVGRIMKKLAELGLGENTIIIFTSDNGGLSTRRGNSPTSNVPLRAGKGWVYEGGIREPLFISWPGVIEPGSVCDTPVISTDFFPTILEMTDIGLRPDLHRDGISLVPLLKAEHEIMRESLCWHFPHYHGSGHLPAGAIRLGDFKLIEWFEDDRTELYNLALDPGERQDLSDTLPEKGKELLEKLRQWRSETEAKMPTPNPDWKKK